LVVSTEPILSAKSADCGADTASQPIFGPTAHPVGATQIWHSGQVGGGPPTQVPLLHASAVVHALPSSHPVPSGLKPFGGHVVLVPVQVSATSHWPDAARQTEPALPAGCAHAPAPSH
jgi:hypothetical protein